MKDALVEERFNEYDLVAWLDEGHECGEHAFIGAGGDCDLSIWIQLATHDRTICVRYRLLQSGSALWFVRFCCWTYFLSWGPTLVGEY